MARQEVGAKLASIITECVDKVISADADWIFGVVELTADGSHFLAKMNRKAPNTAPVLELTAVVPAIYFEECTVGTEDAIGSPIINNLSLSCKISSDAPTEGVQGFLHFQDDSSGQAKTVSFDVRRDGFIRQSEADSMIERSVSNLKAGIADLKVTIAKLNRAANCSGQQLADFHDKLPSVWDSWVGIAGITDHDAHRKKFIDAFMVSATHDDAVVPVDRRELDADLDKLGRLISGDETC